jgi:hypothetical protein
MYKKIKIFFCTLFLFSFQGLTYYFKEDFREFGFRSRFLRRDLKEKKNLKEVSLLLRFNLT